MNRRDALLAPAALGVAAIAATVANAASVAKPHTGTAYFGGGQCGQCLYAMIAEAGEYRGGRWVQHPRPVMWCVNQSCGELGVRYLVPLTTLERA